MTMRFAVLVLALGLLFQGCTIQKRSHLPGWHVERATALSSKVLEEPDAVVDAKAEPAERAFAVAVAPVPKVAPAPLRSLEAHVPFKRAIAAFQKPRTWAKTTIPEEAETTRDVEHNERDVQGLLYAGVYWLVGAIGWLVFRNADPFTAGPFMLYGVVGGAWLVAFFLSKFLINRRRQSMGKARLRTKALIGLGLAIAMAAALVEIATFDLEISFGG
jgi:hypothetical protein